MTRNLIGVTGLSPRIRGNLRDQGLRRPRRGSIPAHTGKPGSIVAPVVHVKVYPRAYGETERMTKKIFGAWGLSPRIRGNLRDDLAGIHAVRSIPAHTGKPLSKNSRILFIGSIPAHTGKPPSGSSACVCQGVYPRAYGETVPMPSVGTVRGGLSPRIRGNPTLRFLQWQS